MISFSNFGSNTHANALKVKKAVELVKAARPDLPIDGEMQADYAVVPEMLEAEYPWATVQNPNVLIFPDLQSANAAYKLVWRLAGAEAIGPILLGLERPVHVLQRGCEVADIVNMAAIAVVDAQERAEGIAGTAGEVGDAASANYLRYPQLCSLSESSAQRSPMSSR